MVDTIATRMRQSGVLQCSVVITSLLQYAYAATSPHDIEARQQSGLNPEIGDHFLRWRSHQATVAGDYLYVDGGIFSYLSSGVVQVEQSSSVLAVDLAKDWNNATLMITSTTKPKEYPNWNYGGLWYHQSENLVYSSISGLGAHDVGTSPLTLWAFKPDNMGGGNFQTIIDSDSSNWTTPDLIRPYFGLQASGPDKALILGGLNQARYNQTRLMELPGMIEFDMSTGSFTNQSSASIGQPVNSGQMQYVSSFGPDGIFLAFGGYNLEQGLASLDMVPVFDPAAQTWHNQSTSGNTPKGRRDFCVAGVASNNDTYEIFLYGGLGWLGGTFNNSESANWDETPYDTISILTLPAFHWVDVTYDRPISRDSHTCNNVGGSQILIFGGTDYSPSTGHDSVRRSMSSKDPWSQGIGIFDLSNLGWADHYSAHPAPYKQSDPVKQYYALSGESYISSLTPSVATLMKTTNFNHTLTNASPANSTATSTSTTSPSKSIDTSAIAGAVVGGIVFLCIIAVIVFFTLRKRRRLAGHSCAELDSRKPPPYATAEIRHEMDSEIPNPELPSNQMMQSELHEQHLLELGQDRRETRHELQP